MMTGQMVDPLHERAESLVEIACAVAVGSLTTFRHEFLFLGRVDEFDQA